MIKLLLCYCCLPPCIYHFSGRRLPSHAARRARHAVHGRRPRDRRHEQAARGGAPAAARLGRRVRDAARGDGDPPPSATHDATAVRGGR